MDNHLLESFIERYYKDRDEFCEKFNQLNKKIEKIDEKFEGIEGRLDKVDMMVSNFDQMQKFIFSQFGDAGSKLENVKIFLTDIETRLSKYKTLDIQGQKIIDGEFYMLRINLHKVKPIIKWENDRVLSSKYSEIERCFLELEGSKQI
jgi:hypothetical protein